MCTKTTEPNDENVLSEVLESIARADANIKRLSDEIGQSLNKPLNAWSVDEVEIFSSERLTAVSFPFFIPNGERDFHLFERDPLVTEINRCVSQKLAPIIITTSRGMGKTFFLKMFGLQKLQLKSPLIQEALSLARVVSFDFSADIFSDDIYTFVQRLMIFFLCHLFGGKQVDCIHFEGIKDFRNLVEFKGKQTKFNDWKTDCLKMDVESIINEYIRLTNIAFRVDSKIPPVFLFDEIQSLTRSIAKCHTRLSLLLTQLATSHNPVCICTGTDHGSLSETSRVVPILLSLTPLTNEYMRHWNEMTDVKNLEPGLKKFKVTRNPIKSCRF